MNTTPTMDQSSSQVNVKADAVTEISKVTVYAIGISAGVIGCWATACLVAGTISSGGPFGLISNFVKSFIG